MALEIHLRHPDLASLVKDAEANLSRGRAFVVGASGGAEREACVLVVVHPETGAEARLAGEIVFVRDEDPGRGLGLSLEGGSTVASAALRELLGPAFVASERPPASVRGPASAPVPAVAPVPVLEEVGPAEPALEEVGPAEPALEEIGPAEPVLEEIGPAEPGLEELGPADDAPTDVMTEPAEDDAPTDVVAEPADQDDAPTAVDPPFDDDETRTDDDGEPGRAENLHERLRGLSAQEQHRLARSGTLPERIQLERMYGPAVWEALLQNGRITMPEVARIAKKGTLPRPLVELIASNGAWAGAPEVQRALLSNPRSSAVVVNKCLRAMSRVELQKVPQQTAYPQAVRMAAKKLLG